MCIIHITYNMGVIFRRRMRGCRRIRHRLRGRDGESRAPGLDCRRLACATGDQGAAVPVRPAGQPSGRGHLVALQRHSGPRSPGGALLPEQNVDSASTGYTDRRSEVVVPHRRDLPDTAKPFQKSVVWTPRGTGNLTVVMCAICPALRSLCPVRRSFSLSAAL